MSKISELLIGKLKKIQNIPTYPHPTYCNRKPWPDHELCPLRQRQWQHLEHVDLEESQGHPDVLRWHLNLSRLPSQFLHTKFHHVTFLLINQKILSPASTAQTHVLKSLQRYSSWSLFCMSRPPQSHRSAGFPPCIGCVICISHYTIICLLHTVP